MRTQGVLSIAAGLLVLAAVVAAQSNATVPTTSTTLSKACSDDRNCTGPNEFCRFVSSLQTPCPGWDGVCTCDNGYMKAPILNGACIAIDYYALGDYCSKNETTTKRLPFNAVCSDDGIVQCKPAFEQVGAGCTPDVELAPYGAPCKPDANQCRGTLFCNVTSGVCDCPLDSWDYNEKAGQCVPRRFGDECTKDSHCQMATGITKFGSLYCINKTCGCRAGDVKATATYANWLFSDDVVQVDYCMPAKGINRNVETCSPLIGGILAQNAPGWPCESPDQTCNACPGAPMKCTNVTNSRANGLDSDLKLTTVGWNCNADKDCTGPNEQCVPTSWLSPSCTNSVCTCKAGHTNGKMGFGWTPFPCQPVQRLKLGDACSLNYAEFIDPIQLPAARCDGRNVVCAPGYTASSGACVATKGAAFNAACNVPNDCAGTLTCTNKKCACRMPTDTFDALLGDCRRRQLNESCTSNAECAGTVLNGGAVCGAKKVCECASGLVAANVSAFDPIFIGTLLTSNVCVRKTTILNAGDKCPIDPIRYPETADTGICKDRHVCYSCPTGEAEPWRWGRCRKVQKPKDESKLPFTIILDDASSARAVIYSSLLLISASVAAKLLM